MRVIFSIILVSTIGLGVMFGKPSKKDIKLENGVDSLSYSMGILIGQSIKAAGVSQVNEAVFAKAIVDLLKGTEPIIALENANKIVEKEFQKAAAAKKAEGDVAKNENLKKGKDFLAENKKKPGVVELPSGLQYKILKDTIGEKPGEKDKVTVHYHGTTIDGKVFDSSVQRGEPIQFPVNGVIKGWVEALQLMTPGSKWMLYIPSELAYGEQDMPTIPANSVLIFEVELISVEKSN